MFKSIPLALALFSAGAAFYTLPSSAFAEETENTAVTVTIDRAKVFRISRPAGTVIIGNPAIADATIQDDVTLVLTGKSFGLTNLIVLDKDGEPIVDETIVVKGHEVNTVRVYRRDSRATMACAPICEPTLTIGDDNDAFEYAKGQITAKNALSDASK